MTPTALRRAQPCPVVPAFEIETDLGHAARRASEGTAGRNGMQRRRWKLALLAILTVLAGSGWMPLASAQTPKSGGILKFVVPDEPPSFDGHRETTFALIHPIAPFYSVLIRVDPQNPASTTDFVCDLCTEMPKPTDGGKTYTFKIRKGIKFHDGSPLTARDVLATFQHIIFPPDGVQSPRKEHFQMVESLAAPDDETFLIKLKYPSGAFCRRWHRPSTSSTPRRCWTKTRTGSNKT